MRKEEILEKSRKDNKNKDEYEIEMDKRATRIGGLFALFLTTVYYCYEIFTGKGTNPALYSIITSFCAGSYIYVGIRVARNRKINLFAGIIWLILTISLVISYFVGR